MKTAMQELIEYLEIRDAMCKEAGLHSESGTIRMTIGDAKLLLEKEKEQLLDFGLYVKKNGWVGCKIEDLYEDYYNQKK